MFASGGNFTRLQPRPNVVHDGHDIVPTPAKTNCIWRTPPLSKKIHISFSQIPFFNLLIYVLNSDIIK